jgi:hypothetical protein
MNWMQRSYPIFIYLGIFFFIAHLILYGKGLDQSYFGLFLIYVGYSKMEVSQWFFILLWIFCCIELLNLGNQIYEKYLVPLFSQNKKKKGKKVKFSDQENESSVKQ